jgi:hypothetical protein
VATNKSVTLIQLSSERQLSLLPYYDDEYNPYRKVMKITIHDKRNDESYS